MRLITMSCLILCLRFARDAFRLFINSLVHYWKAFLDAVRSCCVMCKTHDNTEYLSNVIIDNAGIAGQPIWEGR